MNKKITKTHLILIIVSLLLSLVTGLLFIFIKELYSTFSLLMLLVFVALIFVPLLIQLIFKIKLPNYIVVAYILFLILSTLIGTVYKMYDRFFLYDTILHYLSGVLLGLLGLYILNLSKQTQSTFIKFIFVFSFSVLFAGLWEIYEFTTDYLFDLNSQRFALQDGTQLVGQLAVQDTMIDLIAGTLGGLTASIAMLFISKNKNKTIENTQSKNHNIENTEENKNN